MLHKRLEHRFVDEIPERIEPGILYVSLQFATAVHSCCCGCGEEVVTPFTPTDWKMTFDGETISLKPSVGSWTLACRSHYVIDRSLVVEALPWTGAEVESGRRRERAAKARHYDHKPPSREMQTAPTPPASSPASPLITRLWRWLTG